MSKRVKLNKEFLPRLSRQLKRRLRIAPAQKSAPKRKIFPDDRFLVSYPRSGSNWLCRLIATAWYPETEWEIDEATGDHKTLKVIPELRSDIDLSAYPRPRLIKTHNSYRANYRKVLYIYRDVRDVVVSFYDLRKAAGRFEGTFDEFFEVFVAGDMEFGRWDKHVESWVFAEQAIPFMAVSYEQLFQETAPVLSNILAFLDRPVSQAAIEQAVARCTFTRYREGFKHHIYHQQGYRGGVKGGPGKGKETLSPEQLDRLWTEMGETMARLGYKR